MESRRAAGLLIAVMSAILIVLAGRSCAKDIEKQNKKNAKAATKPAVVTAEVATSAPDQPPVVQDPPQPQTAEPDTAQPQDPDVQDDTQEETEAPTKSKLDEFWDSEHPSYLDPYGFLDGDDPYGDGGNGNYQATIHIEIG